MFLFLFLAIARFLFFYMRDVCMYMSMFDSLFVSNILKWQHTHNTLTAITTLVSFPLKITNSKNNFFFLVVAAADFLGLLFALCCHADFQFFSEWHQKLTRKKLFSISKNTHTHTHTHSLTLKLTHTHAQKF